MPHTATPVGTFRRTLVTAAVTLAVSHTALASSHREAPGITAMPQVDATDFYAFNSYESGREGYVTLIANYLPLQDAYGGPNYFALDASALYEIHVENTGDAVEDLTFRFRFENATPGAMVPVGDQMVAVPLKAIGPLAGEGAAEGNGNFAETFTLDVVTGDRRTGVLTAATAAAGAETSFAKPIDYVGEKALGDAAAYEGYVSSLTNSGALYHDVTLEACPDGARDARVFVGQRKDPFAISLGRVFDLVNLNPLGALDGNEDDLADKNVTTIALEVQADCLTGGGENTVIGAWTTASKRQVGVLDPTPPSGSVGDTSVEAGAWTQVSRLGSPLVNEVVIGLPDKDLFNASEPKDDGQFATYVTNPTLPFLIDVLFRDAVGASDNIAPSNFPRNDLVAAFLTGIEGVNPSPAPDGAESTTLSEMLRLNTGIPATAAGEQNNLGVAAGDLAGFPNGRRPGDDITDLALRVVMGALCHPIAVDLDEMDGAGSDGDVLPFCTPDQAPVGDAALTDGVVQEASMFDETFPYLTTPIPGSTVGGGESEEGR